MDYNDLGGTGFVLAKLPKNVISECDKIIENILSNLENQDPHNYQLAGHIKKEYRINPPRGLDIFLDEMIELHKSENGHYSDCRKVNDQSFTLELTDFWINLQEKYEFNPIHNHSGVFSFVIWNKVPFHFKDEDLMFPETSSGFAGGRFCFVHTDSRGNIISHKLETDNDMEGYICLFPSNLNHLVNPFYTSDDYRISMSGNIKFNTKIPGFPLEFE